MQPRLITANSVPDMAPLSLERKQQLRKVAAEFGTPVYVYDASVMRERLAQLHQFDAVRYAQKACPNTHVQSLLRKAGALVDCVSLGELERALVAGFSPEGDPSGIVYTADVVTEAALDRIVELNVPLNAGSEDMLEQLGRRHPGHPIWLRLNPGFGSGHSQKVNTGGESSKHGIWSHNVERTLKLVDRYRFDLVGLHMHIGSGADLEHLKRVSGAMVDEVKRWGRDIRAISGGGGLSIPYQTHQAPIDVSGYFSCWDAARKEIEAHLGHHVHLEIEPGRFLTAEAGVLIAEVRAQKTSGKNHFTLVDAGFNDLMRPAMYGAYHDIQLLTRAEEASARPLKTTLVAGPVCESGDVFTQLSGGEPDPRTLPEFHVGDLMVFCDAGAYGASMSSNYNSRPLAPEVLIDGETVRLIRRRQTIDDLLALEH